MIRVIAIFGILAAALLSAPVASAQEAPLWKGNIELSYLDTGGNTNSQTFLVAGKGEYLLDHAKVSGEFAALYGEKSGVALDKSWMGKLKYDRYLVDGVFAYGLEAVDRDVLKGIEIRYNTQVGLGYEFIKTPTDLLKGEVGGGYVRENPVAPFDDRGFPTARAFAEYDHSFRETTRFAQTVEYLPSLKESEDYLFSEESAFITNLMGNLAFKVSYTIKYDNLPPPTFLKTDRLFKTSLLYTF
jgi:putative salt-induced outer membrane protein